MSWLRVVSLAVLMMAAATSSQTAPSQSTPERRREAFDAARRELVRDRNDHGSPSDRLARGRQRVAAMMALAREYADLRSESRELLVAVVMESSALAQMSRFSLADPSTAAALYEQALSVELPPGSVRLLQTIPRIGYADLARFELRDPARAARLLREARDSLRTQPDLNDPRSLLAHPIRRWVEAEIAFLEARRRASVPSAADCAPIELVYQFGREWLLVGNEPLERIMSNGKGPHGGRSRREIASALANLPPSAINLLGAAEKVATLGSSDRLLAFARKHDPAGFTTACVFRRLREIALIPDKARREAVYERYRWTVEDGRLLVATANRVLGPVTRN